MHCVPGFERTRFRHRGDWARSNSWNCCWLSTATTGQVRGSPTTWLAQTRATATRPPTAQTLTKPTRPTTRLAQSVPTPTRQTTAQTQSTPTAQTPPVPSEERPIIHRQVTHHHTRAHRYTLTPSLTNPTHTHLRSLTSRSRALQEARSSREGQIRSVTYVTPTAYQAAKSGQSSSGR